MSFSLKRLLMLSVIFMSLLFFSRRVYAATYESESNNSFTAANSTSVNTMIYGSNSSSSDSDYFKVSVPQNGYATISMTHKRDVGYHDVDVYDGNQQSIFSFTLNSGSAQITTSEVSLKAGVNYIKVKSYQNKDQYSIIINFKPSSFWETEFNNHIDDSDLIQAGNTYFGSTVTSSDKDYFKFNATSNGHATIYFSHKKDIGYHDLTVYDSNQEEIYDIRFKSDAKDSQTKEFPVKKGCNYIKISSYYNKYAYSFFVNYTPSNYWEVEFNNHIDNANGVSIGTTYYGMNRSSSDDDYFRFDVPSAGFYKITFSHKTGIDNHGIKVYNNVQDSIFDTSVKSNKASYTTNELSLSQGRNYIKISSYSNHDMYSFSINRYSISGWMKDSVGWMWRESNGNISKNKWIQYGGKWYYLKADGYMATGWLLIGGVWYYFESDGAMASNAWVKSGSYWYWMTSGGQMAKNTWKKSGSYWYWMKSDGKMATNTWVKSGSYWYWMKSDGIMATNTWVKSGSYWYWMKSDGKMATNTWVKSGSYWYWMKSDGKMATNTWVKSGSYWYYFNGSGHMVTGKQTIGGKSYTFDSSGELMSENVKVSDLNPKKVTLFFH